MNEKLRVRFPPSPTGRLHIGNVRTALYNWLLARKSGGTFVLRIEDTDIQRSTRESENAILEDLRWLGLDWDEGPDKGGSFEPYRQSERLDQYKQLTDKLFEEEKAYYCFCTPEELKAEREQALKEKRPPRYSGRCRNITPEDAAGRMNSGESAAVRFRVEDGPAVAWEDLVHGTLSFEREIIGDPIIVRSDGLPAYNFAVVIDDALMEITHVIRGDDHISNTPRQILIYEALGYDLPKFAHLPMILGPDGSRLSKRHGATSVEEFRSQGYLPEALINYLALLGWNPGDEQEIFSVEELIETFSLERVNKSAAKFSFEKLLWLNGHYLRILDKYQLLERSRSIIEKKFNEPKLFLDNPALGENPADWTRDILYTCSASTATLDRLADEFYYKFFEEERFHPEDPKLDRVLQSEQSRKSLKYLYDGIKSETSITADRFCEITDEIKKRYGLKTKDIFLPTRAILTRSLSGPELDTSVELIERRKKIFPDRKNLKEKLESYLEETENLLANKPYDEA